MLNKLVDLRIFFRESSVHLVVFAGTWFSENGDDALLVSVSNFRVFCCERACEKSRGGGVLLLSRDFLGVLVHSVALASGFELLCVDYKIDIST